MMKAKFLALILSVAMVLPVFAVAQQRAVQPRYQPRYQTYQTYEPYPTYVDSPYERDPWYKSRKVKYIGGGAAGGAVIGGLAGGRKGALIGGLAGAGVGYIIERKTRNK